jgi:CheY-like chemotaxis protein
VLVVEDNPLNRQVAAAQLDFFGIEHTLAENGLIAVQLSKKREFDFVLMDINMPVMNGILATKRIRQLELSKDSRPRVPIVAYTSLDHASARAQIEGAGFDDLLFKPCSPNALGDCLKRHCAGKFLGN